MSVTVVQPPADTRVLTGIANLLSDDTIATPEIRQGLIAFVETLASGSAVRVEAVATLLSTTEAAAILNVSRMTLVKLLDDGKIPYERPSVHRMIRLKDVLTYKEQRSAKRRAFLTESMNQAIADGTFSLGIDDYAEAVEHARHQRL